MTHRDNDSDIFPGGASSTDEITRVIPKKKTHTKRPSMWHVILLNDDFTPMDFVVHILQQVFGLDETAAQKVMWQVHIEGRAIAGTYTYEVSETKQAQVMGLARQHQYPLKAELEQAPDV